MCTGGGSTGAVARIRRGQNQAEQISIGRQRISGFQYNRGATFRKSAASSTGLNSGKAAEVSKTAYMVAGPQKSPMQGGGMGLVGAMRPQAPKVQASYSGADGVISNPMVDKPSRMPNPLGMRSTAKSPQYGDLPATDKNGYVAPTSYSAARMTGPLGISAVQQNRYKVGEQYKYGSAFRGSAGGLDKSYDYEVSAVNKKGTATQVKAYKTQMVSEGGKVYSQKTYGDTYDLAKAGTFSATYTDAAINRTKVKDESAARKKTRRARADTSIVRGRKTLQAKRKTGFRITKAGAQTPGGGSGVNT